MLEQIKIFYFPIKSIIILYSLPTYPNNSILDTLNIDLDHLRRKVEILSPANPNPSSLSNEKKNLHLPKNKILIKNLQF